MTDTAGNQWSYDYDLLGRKIKTVDPDAGTSFTSYHNDGTVADTTDARMIKLVYTYDTLGRKTAVKDAVGNVRASWAYDTVTGGKGQLASTTRVDASGSYLSAVNSYDDAYRPKSTTDTIPGFGVGANPLVYTTSTDYKPNGAIATQTLPAVGDLPAEVLTYTYHPTTGLPNALTGSHASQLTYVASRTYHYDGQANQTVLGVSGKQVKIESLFDNATRRLTTSSFTVEGAVGVFGTPNYADTYTYDLAGNITAIAGAKNGAAEQKQCFTHDHLRRLTEAWTQTAGACTTPQRTGVDPYWRQWLPVDIALDAVGNRLKQKDKEGIGTTWTYAVGGAGTCGIAKPHQVRQITSTGLRAGPARTFCYDAAGNTITRTTETGVTQALHWDDENHLAKIVQGSTTIASYVYGADGQRLVGTTTTTDPTPATTKTVYLPDGTELAKVGAATTLVGNRYYGGTAVRSLAGVKWTIGSHQGSGTFQIDAASKAVSLQRRFMPYGELRTTQPAGWIGTKGHVGGTTDPTGLTHLGAREYDPTTGRFISDDPVTDPMDPQQVHGYTYSSNSPVTYADPTGLYPCCAPASPRARAAGWNWKHELLDFLSWFPIVGDAAMTIDAQIWRAEGRQGRAEELEGLVQTNVAIDAGFLPPTIARIGAKVETGLSLRLGRNLELRTVSIVEGARFEAGQVTYGNTGLSKIAYEYRIRNSVVPSENVAVYLIDLGRGRYQVVIAPNLPRGLHSEQVINNYLKQEGYKTDQVVAIYSERVPCVKSCAGELSQFKNAQNSISWSYTGGSTFGELDMAVRLGRI